METSTEGGRIGHRFVRKVISFCCLRLNAGIDHDGRRPVDVLRPHGFLLSFDARRSHAHHMLAPERIPRRPASLPRLARPNVNDNDPGRIRLADASWRVDKDRWGLKAGGPAIGLGAVERRVGAVRAGPRAAPSVCRRGRR